MHPKGKHEVLCLLGHFKFRIRKNLEGFLEMEHIREREKFSLKMNAAARGSRWFQHSAARAASMSADGLVEQKERPRTVQVGTNCTMHNFEFK
jgi:hypothetical protein